MSEEHVVVLTTTDSEDVAAELASGLVAAGLAACVQIGGPVRSLYRWEGEVKDEREWQLWIKTTYERLPEVNRHIEREHPYEVPEVLALPVLAGSEAYLDWVSEQTAR
ncbi:MULTISPECIES: divalent-cation tolerance protein CutA [Actinosynnema]|uniref:Divalent-cation tolerance protein CutA n=1 Tax=Actinosynnema pretiosum subsp. pretiosum TaxID=103721 RepID=A0AA45R5Z5_9PSEU|nr:MULTISPECIES: divalent-cation tolerance protein CutA [Actinosynnema]QUF06195.1 divalent-cation tolerance protein CutA [Actinosynnema pretiosum subsp. pretiosum]